MPFLVTLAVTIPVTQSVFSISLSSAHSLATLGFSFAQCAPFTEDLQRHEKHTTNINLL